MNKREENEGKREEMCEKRGMAGGELEQRKLQEETKQ